MRILAILALVPAIAHADPLNVTTVDAAPNVVAVTTGAEHGFVVGVGFDHAVLVAEHRVILTADATLSAAGFDLDDFRVRAGALVPLVDGTRWKLLGGASALARGTHDDVARMLDVGVDASAIAGYYTPRWFAAGELGFDAALATHIVATDAYRMSVYPDARDGWYANTGGLFRFGAQGGVSLGQQEVALRAGMLRNSAGDAPIFPIYATLTLARHW